MWKLFNLLPEINAEYTFSPLLLSWNSIVRFYAARKEKKSLTSSALFGFSWMRKSKLYIYIYISRICPLNLLSRANWNATCVCVAQRNASHKCGSYLFLTLAPPSFASLIFVRSFCRGHTLVGETLTSDLCLRPSETRKKSGWERRKNDELDVSRLEQHERASSRCQCWIYMSLCVHRTCKYLKIF